MSEQHWPERIGPYEIQGVLGEGAMGRVYLARQHNPDRDVALKVLKSLSLTADAQRRFEREIAALSALEHPHIARVYAAGESESAGEHVQWFAMERIEGQDLRRFAEAGRGPARILPLVATIARTVHFAHTRGVVHRDIKPGNILVRGNGTPCVLDFGVAHLAETDATQLTQMAETLGTLPYMSPETLMGTGAADDPRIDVYALGVVTYEAIAGRLPYDTRGKTTLVGLLDVLHHGSPTPLRQIAPVSSDLDTIVMKAIAHAPEHRYASAAEFAADLERYLAGQPISARPPSARYLAGLFIRRHKAVTAAAALVVVSLLGATITSARYANAEARARTVADMARQQAEQNAQELGAVNQFLVDMIENANPNMVAKRELTIGEIVDQAARQLNLDSSLSVPVRASVQTSLAKVYDGLGDLDNAKAQADAALAATPDSLEAMATKVSVLLNLGDHDAADQLLDTMEQADQGESAYVQQLRARYLGLTGEYDAAVQMLDAILADSGNLESNMQLTMPVQQLKVRFLYESGQFDRAATVADSATDYWAPRLHAGHPHLLSLSNARIVALMDQGKNAEALPIAKSNFEVAVDALGADHPSTVSKHQILGRIHRNLGQLDEAETILLAVLESQRTNMGDGFEGTLTTMAEVAYLQELQGKLGEAEALYREALAGFARTSGPEHFRTLTARNNLAACLMTAGKHDEAVQQLEQVVATMEAKVGTQHPFWGAYASSLGKAYTGAGRYVEARAMLEPALAVLTEAFGPEHRHTTNALQRLEALDVAERNAGQS